MSLSKFDDDNFKAEVLSSDVPVLVDFYATWCGPCKVMDPIIEELATEYDGRIKIGKLNIDDAPLTPGQFGVRGVPTLIFFNNGEPVDLLQGPRKKPELKTKLDGLLV